MTQAPAMDVFWHDDVLFHDTGFGFFEAPENPLLSVQMVHPESADRIRNMKAVLQRGPVAQSLRWHRGTHASEADIVRFHDEAYVAEIKRAAHEGRRFSSTTLLRPGAWPGLLAAAGTTLDAGRHVRETGAPAFALVRPPGHHAGRAMADGYCFFNHVGIAAEDALANGIGRVAIIDWDVHHGNGTQSGFYDRADVLTVSMHMDHGAWGPTHPETGSIDERGMGAGLGFNLNIPLPMGSSDTTYLGAFDEIVAPKVRAFKPNLLIIANGVDAGQFDPNGRQLVTMSGFHALASRARALADELCSGRLLVVQEGGYNPAYAAFSVHSAIEGFAGLPESLKDPLGYMPQARERAERDVAALKAGILAGI
ncbi:class II histone deacetylase [Shinella sp. HZN7]|uniref:class II histone deacetylase n=1 Tax=Shinella sp. (strain HZN7) TaxID=879274 RepID=UPI000A7710D4|nr:class II histone deacetylase [Shinella sp. HZN7]